MKTILVLGAGRSSASLIRYLLKKAEAKAWLVTVGDLSEAAAQRSIAQSPYGKAICFNLGDDITSKSAIAEADVVISLLPPALHVPVAKHCLSLKKHLLTASYVSVEMKQFHEEALQQNLLFLNECGLDPGIDHMSAMAIIDKIKDGGGVLTAFESFTGGLIVPETDPANPWRYKFTWNPRNVVTAGQGTAKYLEQGQFKYIPYHQLFKRTTLIEVPGYGRYEGYANRDSLKYIDTYGLTSIQTMLRGTLRHEGFCAAWDVFVQLGCCDDSYPMEGVATMTHRSFINSFLPQDKRTVEERLCAQTGIDRKGDTFEKLQWAGMFEETLTGLTQGTPAQLLEHILNKKWKLDPGDKDLIVMWHRFTYTVRGVEKELQASLVVQGDDATQTAMAKTVGLPLAMATQYLLDGSITSRGVAIPTSREFYEPILAALKTEGITLQESETR